jgi:hypothetical protein
MEIIALDAHKRYSQVRYGKLRNDVNHYLKWAYCEAGNSTAVNHKRFPLRHTSHFNLLFSIEYLLLDIYYWG